jgi:RNA polymerase sigma factor (sigma-70 family)
MTKIYIKNDEGQRIYIEVTKEVANADTEFRRAEWRNDAKEKYYRDPKLHDLNDKDEELACEEHNPERKIIVAEEKKEFRAKMIAALKSLTPEQLELVKFLKAGKTITQIATHFGVSKAAVSQMRNRIQEKFKKFLK